jgi:hypothetical protein
MRAAARVERWPKGRWQMIQEYKAATAAVAIMLAMAAASGALAAIPIERAELAGLSPQLRAQVLACATHGNSVTEFLQVMLLNNIKIKHEASLIVALDWGPGVAVVQQPNGALAAVHFDPKTLQITS